MTTLPLLKELGSPALVRGLGYALLHSLWQGGVLALLLAGVLPLLRRQRAEVRYAVSAGALASLLLVVGLTFGVYYQNAPTSVLPDSLAVELVGPTASQPTARPLALATTTTTLTIAVGPGGAVPLAWLAGASRRVEPYLPLLVVGWLLGLLLMSGRLAGGLLYAGRLRRAGTQALGAEWQQRLAALAARAGVRRPVALLESARVAGPLVLGHLRPVILLPLGAVAGLSPALLEALLAHELAHIVRRDYLLNLVLAGAEVLFFYHPAVWFMANCLRAERENCCDDQAAALCGGDRLRVARALAALAETEAATAPLPRLALAAAGAGGRGSLLARVRRLALGRPEAPSRSERLLAGSLTLVGLLGLSTGVVLAARPAQTAPGQTAPADTTRRVAAAPALPALPALPASPALPGLPGVPALPGLPALPDTMRRMEQNVRVMVGNDEPESRSRRRRQQEPPRRGQASTVVIEKDKKGRVVNLTVDGQRVETDQPGKKNKHGKPVRTVEVVLPSPVEHRLEVVRAPDQLRRIERLETAGLPEAQSFSFDFSTDGFADKAALAARQGLAEALRSPDLTVEERQQMQKELSKLDSKGPRLRMLRNGHEVRELHLNMNLNLNGAAASHPAPPSYRLERTKRGYVRLEFNKSGRIISGPAEQEADRAARQADRDAAQADRDAEQANRDATQPDRATTRAEAAGRRAELRARMAADAAELRALEAGSTRRQQVPAPPRPPRGPQGPMSPQGPPMPQVPPAPQTAELRAALRQDGLIGKDDRSFTFELNDRGGKANGKALTPAQVARYRQLLNKPVSQGKGKSSFSISVNENEN